MKISAAWSDMMCSENSELFHSKKRQNALAALHMFEVDLSESSANFILFNNSKMCHMR
jgi:hypothetical protein